MKVAGAGLALYAMAVCAAVALGVLWRVFEWAAGL